MSAVKETVYIKGDESVEVTSQTVNLGDLVELECSDPKILPRLRTIHVLKFVDSSKKYSYHRRSRTVVSVLKLIQCIHDVYPADGCTESWCTGYHRHLGKPEDSRGGLTLAEDLSPWCSYHFPDPHFLLWLLIMTWMYPDYLIRSMNG